MDQIELEGMPRAATLRLVASEGQVLVAWGNSLVCRYESDDNGMRNLVIVALTDAGHLPLGELAGAPAALDQPGRTIPVGPPAQDRHVCRGQPEDARVRQRHDHEVAHPVVVALVPADQ